MKRTILYCCLAMLLLAGCSWVSAGPTGGEVVSQASDGDKIAFDVVKVDDAVVSVLREQGDPAFHERFKKYLPPPDLKIAVGDTVSVVIWEAAANGLFGTSLTEWSVPAAPSTRGLTGQLPASPGASRQTQSPIAAPDPSALLFGGAGAAALGLNGL